MRTIKIEAYSDSKVVKALGDYIVYAELRGNELDPMIEEIGKVIGRYIGSKGFHIESRLIKSFSKGLYKST